MGVRIMAAGKGHAVLTSPPMSNPNDTKCLQLDTILTVCTCEEEKQRPIVEFNIYALDVNTKDVNPLLTRMRDFIPQSWKLLQIALPKGDFQIQFEVIPLLAGIKLMTYASNGIFEMANVTILDGKCDQGMFLLFIDFLFLL